MTPEQFAYWLQGHAEMNDGVPSAEQWKTIKAHLATVFVKETPNYFMKDCSTPSIPVDKDSILIC